MSNEISHRIRNFSKKNKLRIENTKYISSNVLKIPETSRVVATSKSIFPLKGGKFNFFPCHFSLILAHCVLDVNPVCT